MVCWFKRYLHKQSYWGPVLIHLSIMEQLTSKLGTWSKRFFSCPCPELLVLSWGLMVLACPFQHGTFYDPVIMNTNQSGISTLYFENVNYLTTLTVFTVGLKSSALLQECLWKNRLCALKESARAFGQKYFLRVIFHHCVNSPLGE